MNSSSHGVLLRWIIPLKILRWVYSLMGAPYFMIPPQMDSFSYELLQKRALGNGFQVLAIGKHAICRQEGKVIRGQSGRSGWSDRGTRLEFVPCSGSAAMPHSVRMGLADRPTKTRTRTKRQEGSPLLAIIRPKWRYLDFKKFC
ncbi:hypothetical protein NPIL_463471 [Nephila pilipes]|uniref:Uncharacterized protein n=1 Tax=Nephila pilipes TaxID=299642 RepID=A0A8X6QNE2_NEPPI|nr:hypothetical protein NPIL_463471 [Nephila pilipes]